MDKGLVPPSLRLVKPGAPPLAVDVALGRAFDTDGPLPGSWVLDGAAADVAHVRRYVAVDVLNGGRLDLELAVDSLGVPQPGWERDKFDLHGGDPAIVARVHLRHVERGYQLKLDRLPELLARPFDVEKLPEARAAALPTTAPVAESKAYLYETKTLLADYLAARMARKRSEGTRDFIEKRTKPLVRLLPKYARDITHQALLGYITTRTADGAGEVIRKEVHSVLRPALVQAFKSDLFERDPLKVIPEMDNRSQPRERWLTASEVWAVALWLTMHGKAHRAAQIVYAVAVGAEPIATPRARREDVREDFRGAAVRGSKNKRRYRLAATPMPLQREMLRWALKHADGGKGGTLFSAWSNARRDIIEACEAIGIPPFAPTDLRRSYATWLGNLGIRDELIRRSMGHAPGSVLEKHYRKTSDDELLRQMEDEYARACAGDVLPESVIEPNSQGRIENPRVGGSIPSLGTAPRVDVPRSGGEAPRGVLASLAIAVGEAAVAREWVIVRELIAELRALREAGVS